LKRGFLHETAGHNERSLLNQKIELLWKGGGALFIKKSPRKPEYPERGCPKAAAGKGPQKYVNTGRKRVQFTKRVKGVGPGNCMSGRAKKIPEPHKARLIKNIRKEEKRKENHFCFWGDQRRGKTEGVGCSGDYTKG